MTTGIFRTIYMAVNDGIKVCDDFYANRNAKLKTVLGIAKASGAEGFIPSSTGYVSALVYKQGNVPPGMKKYPTQSGLGKGHVAVIPSRDKSADKFRDIMLSMPKIPTDADLLREFGWDPDQFIIEGGQVHFATVHLVSQPIPRYFINLPRQMDDKYTPPDTLKEVTQSFYMEALKDHNDVVNKLKSEAAE